MTISCAEVIRQISDYINGDMDGGLPQAIHEHLKDCAHCTAVYDGTRNVIQLVCDKRTFELPSGFSQRLYARLMAQK